MKRYFAICIFLCLLISAVRVLSQPRNEREVQRFTDLMQERLALSSEQYARVLEINVEAATKASKALQQTSDQTILRQKLESIRDQIDTSLLEILSSLQWRKWIELDEELNGHESDI
jgi:uncharacterized tellurite resistance protein B-like protein